MWLVVVSSAVVEGRLSPSARCGPGRAETPPPPHTDTSAGERSTVPARLQPRDPRTRTEDHLTEITSSCTQNRGEGGRRNETYREKEGKQRRKTTVRDLRKEMYEK